MAQQTNQFRQSVEAGMIALNAIEGRTLPVKLAEGSDEVKAGDAVVLDSNSTGPIIAVKAVEEKTEEIIGVVAYNVNKTVYKEGDCFDIFIGGKIIFAEIGESVDAGNKLTWHPEAEGDDEEIIPAGFFKTVYEAEGEPTGETEDAIALDKQSKGIGRIIVKGIL